MTEQKVYLMLDATCFKVKISRDPVHVSNEAPERVHLVLHDEQDGGQQVGHALKLRKMLYVAVG